MDLPYKAEYAKSNRSKCRSCKSEIGTGSLRLAAMVQSPFFDGKTPNWYHFQCFWGKQRPKSADEIDNFDALRYPDQEKIKNNIVSASSVILPDKKVKGKKRDAAELAQKKSALKDFTIEYSKSSRAGCRGCEQKIMKEEIRISKKDYETEVGMKYGGQAMWYHVGCFAKCRVDLGYFESAEVLPGFKSLKKEDQASVKKEIPAIKQEDCPDIKKVKKDDGEDAEIEKKIKAQMKIFYRYRDLLKNSLSKAELKELLEYNDQELPPGEDRILDALADIMTFGSLKPCDLCKTGQYSFKKIGYLCRGNLTEWTKCNNVNKAPPREPFKVPSGFGDEYGFLKSYKYVKRDRVLRNVVLPVDVKKEVKDEVDGAGPRVQRALPALYDMQFVILGKPERGKAELQKQITKLGGKVTTTIQKTVMAVIASKELVEKHGSRIQEAEIEDIHIVPETFVDEAPKHVGKIPDLVLSMNICTWGSDPNTRLPLAPSTSNKSKSKSAYSKSGPSKVTLKVKDGAAVDPESGLEDRAHVYQERDDKYTVVLGITDVAKQKNSYYKLQILESDGKNRYWVFRSWGRIGTTIGGTKLDKFDSLHKAKQLFLEHYQEKSGNMWESRKNFVKVAGRMYPLDLDYGEQDQNKVRDLVDAPTTLNPSVADLVRLIFDVQKMKQMMLEFELDTEKMPLGKISKKQILKAYGILDELQKLVQKEAPAPKIVDATNRFFTFIPHTFGVKEVPILDSEEIIKQKIEMLDNLMELEIAYNLLQSGDTEGNLDTYYEKLNTTIEVLDRESEEFAVIQEYVKNTHAATHSNYTLVIEDIYTIKRQGEEKRFKPFRKLPNRKLLWHGSRVTNFAGILSQGLRIAPPEAPVTGYMFGKGIYFADMVSKSANYCATNSQSPTGLMLLCDVALGNMYETNKAEYVEKLPKGKHSTKGVGRTCPDPNASKKLGDIEVPAGPPITANDDKRGQLLYNEYIVYDVAQVHIKYLLKLNFKYSY